MNSSLVAKARYSPHGGQGADVVGPESEQETKTEGEHDEVSEERPPEKECRGDDDQRPQETPFVTVEAGGDEHPELVEEDGARHDRAGEESDLEVGEEGLGNRGEDELPPLGHDADQGIDEDVEEGFLEGVTEQKSGPQGEKTLDQPRTKLREVGRERDLVILGQHGGAFLTGAGLGSGLSAGFVGGRRGPGRG